MNNGLTNINQGTQFDIFNYKNLGSVRCYVDQQGMKWFCMMDVCNILGINNSRQATTRLDSRGVITNDTLTNGGIQQLIFVNEGNLMELIFTSRKPEAKEFRAWVCNEVLPNLMNKGYYAMNKPATTEELLACAVSHIHDINIRVTSLEEFREEAEKLFHLYGMTGRVTIRGYAIVNNIAITNNEAKFLGGEATKLTLERGMCVDTVPDPRWGVVNTYPKEILDEVFSNYFTNRNN